MFTGLVQAVGTLQGIEPRGPGLRVVVDVGAWDHSPAIGDSIAVDGCCLTVGEARGSSVAFDLVAETVSRTTMGSRRVGDRVNLEHAVRADTLMGGHFVQGHIDGVGEVVRVEAHTGDWRIEVRPPAWMMECMVPKGSVAIEGVSLTIARVGPDSFGVALIPTTLERTTLGELRAGGLVNLEADMVAKTVVHWMRNFRDARPG